MSRRALCPLPEESAKNVRLVKAKYEQEIRKSMLEWHAEASHSGNLPAPLSCQHQSQLRDLIIDMAVHLGESEGREYLAMAQLPEQLEFDIDQLMDAVADEARERWNHLAARFNMEAGKDGDPGEAIHSHVRGRLEPTVDRLLIHAWSQHQERLMADGAGLPLRNAAPGLVETLSPNSLLRTSEFQAGRARLAGRLDKLRRHKGMSVERLAQKAGVDRKTITRILQRKHDAHPETVSCLAGALGVSIDELLD